MNERGVIIEGVFYSFEDIRLANNGYGPCGDGVCYDAKHAINALLDYIEAQAAEKVKSQWDAFVSSVNFSIKNMFGGNTETSGARCKFWNEQAATRYPESAEVE